MFNQRILAFGGVAVALLSSAFSEEALAEVLFQLKFEPEKVYLTDSEMKQSMTMPMAGQQMKTSALINATTSQTVKKVEEGGEIVQKMESMMMDMDAAGMKMNFNSENPQGPMAAMMAPMMDAKTTLVVNGDGNVVSVEAKALPGMENLGMGEDEMKQTARELLDMMANKKVSEGGSWKSISKMPMAGLTEEPVTINYTLTFEKMTEYEGHDVAQVKIEGVVDANDGNLQVTSKELTGQMLFDPAIGQPREVKMVVDLEIALPEGAAAAEGAPGKMPMRTETVSKLKEIK